MSALDTVNELSPEYTFKFYQSYHDQWVQSAFWPIIISTILYLPIVFGLKYYYKDRPAYSGTTPLIAWNFALSFLSALGSLTLIFGSDPRNLFYRHRSFSDHSEAGAAVITLFCITKIVEYGDTFLLCIKKRPTIFLHLYHHVTVALYCLHAVMYQAPYGHIFVFVNLNIHAVMYCYYALAIMKSTKGHPLMRAVRPYITSMQLLQMFLGTAIAYTECVWPTTDNRDIVRDRNLALGMYISYAYLFGDFWIKNYTRSAPVRTLLGCTPIAMLTLTIPLALQQNTESVVTLTGAVLFSSVTMFSMYMMEKLGGDRRLTIGGMLSPMAGTASDFKNDTVIENEPNKSMAIFAPGQSACVDIIRYVTLPVCILLFGLRSSPIKLIEVNEGVAFLVLSVFWILHGFVAGAWAPAESHKRRHVSEDEKKNEKAEVEESPRGKEEKTSDTELEQDLKRDEGESVVVN